MLLLSCQMSVTTLVIPGPSPTSLLSFEVDGTTYDPKDGSVLDFDTAAAYPNAHALAETCVLCNDSSISLAHGAYRASGLPTEAALRVSGV